MSARIELVESLAHAIRFLGISQDWEPASGVTPEDAGAFKGEPVRVSVNGGRWNLVLLHGVVTQYLGIHDADYRYVSVVAKRPYPREAL